MLNFQEVSINMQTATTTVQLSTGMSDSHNLFSPTPCSGFMSIVTSFHNNMETQMSANEDFIKYFITLLSFIKIQSSTHMSSL